MLAEVLNDDFRFLSKVVRVQGNEPRDRSFGFCFIDLGVIRGFLLDLPVRVVCGVVLQHINDEAFINCLLH